MKTTFLILYLFLLLSTCQQRQVQYDNSVATTTVTETVGNENSSKNEIFIGKEFYAGDELSDYDCIKIVIILNLIVFVIVFTSH